MKAVMIRVVVNVSGMAGLLVLFGAAVPQYTGHQHCEPLSRS